MPPGLTYSKVKRGGYKLFLPSLLHLKARLTENLRFLLVSCCEAGIFSPMLVFPMTRKDKDLETLEKLKKLKRTYEGLRNLYFLTRSARHETKLRQAFKEYRTFIDKHKISPREIEHVEAVILKSSESAKIRKKPVGKADKPSEEHLLKTIQAEKISNQILDFMKTREGYIFIGDITPHISLSVCHLRRHLYRLHEEGLLEQRLENRRYSWRKA